MATAQKLYTVEFMLNAMLNSGFTSAFAQAQQKFVDLGNEIKQLQRAQSDISAYQKQQQAVQNTAAKLENLRAQEEALIRQIDAEKAANGEDSASVAALEREKLKLEQRIASTEQALERQNQKLQETGQRLQEAGIGTQVMVDAYQRQQQAVQAATQQLENYRERLEPLNTKILENEQAQAALEAQIRALELAMASASGNGLPVLTERYENLQQELNRTTSETAKLEQEKQRLEQSIAHTEQSLQSENQKLMESEQRLKAAGVDTQNLVTDDNQLADASTNLAEKIAKLKQEQQAAKEEAERLRLEQQQNEETARETAAAVTMLTETLGTMKDAFMACVDVAMDFEQAMSGVEAISSATADEMDALTEKAKETGATTKFTAQESAEAMEYMAMAGWDAEEMLNGLDGVVALSAAAGEDLAQTSDIVTDNLTAFGLTASDTAHFADVLAAAAANSNTNVSIMGDTFKSSAAVAGALGFTIEDVAVATGLMANAGIKGSRAGTALRNIFNGLLDGATLTGDAIGQVQYSMVKSDGTMKTFSETIGELRYYFDQMTEAEKVSNANIVAGMRGYNGLLAILNTTDEEYQELTDVINDCSGAAQEMADIKMDNLAGDVALAESAWEALKDSIGEEFIPVARVAVTAVTDLVTGLNNFVQANPGVVSGIVSFVGALLTATTAATALSGVIKGLPILWGAITSNPVVAGILAVATGIGVVTGAVTQFISKVNEGVPSVDDLTDSLQTMEDTMAEAKSTYDDTEGNIESNVRAAGRYIDRLDELTDTLGDSATQSEEYRVVLSLLKDTVPELSDMIDEETGSIQGGTDALRAYTEAWEEEAKQQAYQEYLKSYYESYNNALEEQTENELKLTEAKNNLAAAELKRKEALEAIQNLPVEEKLSMGDDYQYWTDQLDEANGEIQKYTYSVNNLETALDQSNGKLEEAGDALSSVISAMEDLNSETNNLDTIGLSTQLQNLAERYQNAQEEAYNSFHTQFSLFDTAKADAEQTVDAVQKALDSQLEYWRSYNSNIETLKNKSWEDLGVTQEAYEGFITWLSDGSAEAAGYAANLANASDEALAEAINTYGEIDTEQQKASETVAEWLTDFEGQLADALQYMEDTIEGMEQSDEAYEAAKETMDAYAQAVKDGTADAVYYAQQAAAAVSAALAGGVYQVKTYYTPATLGGGTGGATSDSGAHDSGYASGTDSASEGWHMVGENGPELVYLSGGETVLNNSNTTQIVHAMREARDNANRDATSHTALPVSFDIPELAPLSMGVDVPELAPLSMGVDVPELSPLSMGVDVPELSPLSMGVDVPELSPLSMGVDVPELSPLSMGVDVPELSPLSVTAEPAAAPVYSMRDAGAEPSFGDVNITLNVPNNVASIPDLSEWMRTTGAEIITDGLRKTERNRNRMRL